MESRDHQSALVANQAAESSIIRTLISLSLGLPLLTIAWGLVDAQAAVHAQRIAASLLHCLYWLNTPVATLLLGLLLWVALGARGRQRLGGLSHPEFSRLAWFAMLLTAGLGSQLIVWGGVAPWPELSQYQYPDRSPDTALAALAQAQFHWGLHAWVWALVCARLLALQPRHLGTSNLYAPQTWRLGVRTATELALLLGAVFALILAMPLGAGWLTSGLSQLSGYALAQTTEVVVLLVIVLVASLAAIAGLQRGLKPLALAASLALLGLMVVVWISGGALDGAKLTIATIGEYLSALPRLSFATQPFLTGHGGHWSGDWTQQAFIRCLLSAPLVGLFIARISRGRPLRELLLAGLLVPTLVSFLWISLADGAQLRLALAADSSSMHSHSTMTALDAWALFEPGVFSAPALTLGLGLGLLAASGLLAAMLGAQLYALANLTTAGGCDSSWRMRLFWCLALGVLGLGLLLIKGEAAAQAAALVAGIGTLIALLALSLNLLRRLRACHKISVSL